MNEETTDHIDWDVFWLDADEDRKNMAATGQYGKAEELEQFFVERLYPGTVGSFGCGPADCERSIAVRHPDIGFYCYDTAASVIEQNRQETDLANLEFRVETLPEIETKRQFDIVYCFATLFYVAEIEAAVENLYARVRQGGYLLFDYLNRLSPAGFRRVIDHPGNDTEWFQRRYALVLDRENLLSYERIHDLLGRWPQSYAAIVDGAAGARAAPQVVVPK